MDINKLLSSVTSRTKAIIPVHLFGNPMDVSELKNVIPNQISIVEDAACALGASFRGTCIGENSTAAVYSFHPRKSLTTGEGGMVLSNSESFIEIVKKLRNHGQSPDILCGEKKEMLDCDILGYNYRMTDFQAALGVSQINRFSSEIQVRNKLAEVYLRGLGDVNGLNLPEVTPGGVHAWQSFVVMIDPLKAKTNRYQLALYLKECGIETRPGTHAVHSLKYYREKYSLDRKDFPRAYFCFENSLAIPIHSQMSLGQAEYVVECIKKGLRC